jgi:glycerol-3-phosphate dehydrogenase
LPSGRVCQTSHTQLVGAENAVLLDRELAKGVPHDVLEHLICSYGDRVNAVLKYASGNRVRRLCSGMPYIESEIAYLVHHEFACNVEDILFRRFRTGMISEKIAAAMALRIEELMPV